MGLLFLEKFKLKNMNKVFLTCLFSLGILFSSWAQNSREAPEFELKKSEIEGHLRFLASDALQGRRTGEMGNDMAANYIAAYLEAYGVKKVPGMDSYFQDVPMEATTPPSSASFELNKKVYTQGENLLILSGNTPSIKADAIFANFGWVDKESGHDDYKGLDVKGKVVVLLPGTPEGQDPLTVFTSMKAKRQMAQERGAVAVIELYRLPFPWNFFRQYFNKENLSLAADDNSQEDSIVYGWLKEGDDNENIQKLQNGKKAKVALNSEGYARRDVSAQNVIGIIEGSDPKLKDEYLLLTAHYDHVGTGANGGGPYTPEDSIFNGARDNGMGTVALLAAAKAIAEKPVKRSVIILAVTGEEVGLLGSQYYAENPIIPLHKTVFNLNTDGAGYNDVSYVSIVGYGRTGTDEIMDASANIFGLDVFPNPAPEQNLYDRSDNVSFAAAGVPAICFSPGATGFNEEIAHYYHQVTDNPDTVDYDYLLKFSKAFSRAARLVGNEATRPWWVKGDKYEEAGIKLYKYKP